MGMNESEQETHNTVADNDGCPILIFRHPTTFGILIPTPSLNTYSNIYGYYTVNYSPVTWLSSDYN